MPRGVERRDRPLVDRGCWSGLLRCSPSLQTFAAAAKRPARFNANPSDKTDPATEQSPEPRAEKTARGARCFATPTVPLCSARKSSGNMAV